jgi:hypothetical protein
MLRGAAHGGVHLCLLLARGIGLSPIRLTGQTTISAAMKGLLLYKLLLRSSNVNGK